jgi:electron transfer flavoprotein beta subunit
LRLRRKREKLGEVPRREDVNIVVLVKQVPETDSLALDPETGTVKRSAATSIVNPLDLYAIEAALRIKDRNPETTIKAVSMGPPQAATALREAMAMGCDEGILLTGLAFAGADTVATARALAAAVKKLAPVDLILCGEKATDGDTGQVGPEVAAFLDLPVITYASSLEIQRDRARAGRVTEEGDQVAECRLPAVLSFCKALGEPRLPLLSGKVKAHGAAIRNLGAEELGAGTELFGSKGSPTRVSKIASPKLAREAEILDGRGEEGTELACRRILALLEEKGFAGATTAGAATKAAKAAAQGGRA